jgi:hypothetical protein
MEGADHAGGSRQAGGGQVTTGWWRRNRWGLLLLVPALALGLYSPARNAYAQYWKKQPHSPVSSTPGGWVSFADARMRVERLAVDPDLKDFFGEPFKVADGAQPWRAAIDFDTRNQRELAICQVYLEAADGDLYSENPSELGDYDVSGLTSCGAPDATGAPDEKYQVVVYFLLPPGVRPAAVRIIVGGHLPGYARLAPP